MGRTGLAAVFFFAAVVAATVLAIVMAHFFMAHFLVPHFGGAAGFPPAVILVHLNKVDRVAAGVVATAELFPMALFMFRNMHIHNGCALHHCADNDRLCVYDGGRGGVADRNLAEHAGRELAADRQVHIGLCLRGAGE